MPDTLSLSTGVSLGLLAGIVSGVYYLVSNGVTWPKNEREGGRCIAASRDDGVCRSCGGDTHGGALPCICFKREPLHFESGAWFLQQIHRAISVMPWSISTEKLEQIEEECDGYDNPGPSDPTRGELRKIREFLETISTKLAGGPLEGTRVAPLYDHPAWHFLIGRPLTSLPTPVSDQNDNPGPLQRHARLEQIRRHFWQRWQKEYVSEMQMRTKWRHNYDSLSVGDLVVIQEDNVPPLSWRLGRVTRLFPGSDGISRVADVKTVRGCIRRAFTRLCPLPKPDETL